MCFDLDHHLLRNQWGGLAILAIALWLVADPFDAASEDELLLDDNIKTKPIARRFGGVPKASRESRWPCLVRHSHEIKPNEYARDTDPQHQ